MKLEVRLENETVWLNIDEMSQLFGRDISVIGKHIRNIFKEGELVRNSVWAKFAYTASDGKKYQVDYYNLDVIISVGYRVKNHRGTQFRQWANKVLKEYLLKGYSINQRLDTNCLVQMISVHSPYRLAWHGGIFERFTGRIMMSSESYRSMNRQWLISVAVVLHE